MKPERGDRISESESGFRKRTFDFGIRCIRLAESLPTSAPAQIIGRPLLRSATSVGANYRAAVRGRSRADFVSKMGIVEEECDETLHWLEVLTELKSVKKQLVRDLQTEGNEILAITVASIKTARRNSKP